MQTQTIVTRFGIRFKRTFGTDLSKYHTWYGFDIIGFERDFVPENIDSISLSMYDHCKIKFGLAAAELLRAIIEYCADPAELNTDLKAFMSGEKKEFTVMGGTFFHPVAKRVTGNIYYPFATHKDGGAYTITHLPSGHFVLANLTKRATQDMVSILLAEFADAMHTVEYTQETYNRLLDRVGHLR